MPAELARGVEACRGKILAKQAGIDDRTLEVAKVAVMRSNEEVPLPGAEEFRLVGEKDGDFVLAWVSQGGDQQTSTVKVPRKLIADIEAAPDTWNALRDAIAEGLVVDFQRELLAA